MTTLVKFIITLTLAAMHALAMGQETKLTNPISKFDTYAKELDTDNKEALTFKQSEMEAVNTKILPTKL